MNRKEEIKKLEEKIRNCKDEDTYNELREKLSYLKYELQQDDLEEEKYLQSKGMQ